MKLRRALNLHEIICRGNYRVNVIEGKVYQKNGKELRAYSDGRGYLTVGLYMHGTRYKFKLHEVVAYVAGLPIVGYDRKVDHLDFNPHNNSIENLRVLSSIENNKRKSTEKGRLSNAS